MFLCANLRLHMNLIVSQSDAVTRLLQIISMVVC